VDKNYAFLLLDPTFGTVGQWPVNFHNQATAYSKYDVKERTPRQNWPDVVRRDLKTMGLNWDEATEVTINISEWRQRVVA